MFNFLLSLLSLLVVFVDLTQSVRDLIRDDETPAIVINVSSDALDE